MACSSPLRAWRDGASITFPGYGGASNLTLPCGQCRWCRLERSRQWAVRCMHEAKLHKHNSFVTLTYNDDHLVDRFDTGLKRRDGSTAWGGNLHYRHVQLFLKRLLKAATAPLRSGILTTPPTADQTRARSSRASAIRFYMAGEYGEQYRRPHYHLCLFNVDFSDKLYLAKTSAGSKLYRSATLEKLWPLGFSSVGELTFESAAYAARYVMKKQTGPNSEEKYEQINAETGEIITLKKEFNQMSRRTGIGKEWLIKYTADVYPADEVIVRGKSTKPPRYYDKLYSELNPTGWEAIELDRIQEQAKRWDYHELGYKRRQVKDQVLAARINNLKRKL